MAICITCALSDARSATPFLLHLHWPNIKGTVDQQDIAMLINPNPKLPRLWKQAGAARTPWLQNSETMFAMHTPARVIYSCLFAALDAAVVLNVSQDVEDGRRACVAEALQRFEAWLARLVPKAHCLPFSHMHCCGLAQLQKSIE